MESPLHDHAQLTGIALVVLAALGGGLLMQRFRQPALVGYIVAGVVLGPSGAGLVENREAINQLAELGVLMLLFLLGMELSLRSIRQVWKIALFTTAFQIGACLAVMLIMMGLFDWPLARAVLLAFVVAISSTAVAIKMLDEIGELRSRVGQVTVGVLIAQDLAVVPMMVIVGAMGGEQGGALQAAISVVGSVAFLLLLIAYLSRRKRISLPFARVVGNSPELTALGGLAFCFGAAAVTGILGLSAAYGAFLAGLVIGNSTSRRAMIHHTASIQSVLLMVFFLSIGLLIDLRFTLENLGTVLALVAFIAIFKTALNILVIRMLGESWPRAFLAGALLAQIGEFSFILAAIGVSAGSVSPEIHKLIVSVTVLSLATSPFWLEIARRLHRVLLLGITSPREAMRLTFGQFAADSLFRASMRPQDRMFEMATGSTRWMGEIMPRSRRSRIPRSDDPTPR